MRLSSTLCLLLASAALAASGCVTSGTHREVVSERDDLRARNRSLADRVELLQASNESLGAERVELLDAMEDLRQKEETLARSVRSLERREKNLSTNLEARESELATRNVELDRLRGTYEGLVEDLEEEVASGQIEIEQLRSGVRLNLAQDVLFASGEARLNAAGASVLRKVAKRLGAIPNEIEVQGHTDDVPISTPRFPSNWELAAARASEVVRLLSREGIDAPRLTAVSFGEHAPIASNESPEGRTKNRRIEIRLEPAPPELPAKVEPAPAS